MKTVADIEDTKLRAPHVATGEVVALFGAAAARDLYAAFQDFNARFFDRKLAPPLVLITQAASSRTLGDYVARDVHGLESRIRIAPAAVKRGMLFALDVLLHEMVHAWQAEIAGDGENGYRGHGPRFASQCNRIGAELGLPPVGVKKRDGLPDCAQWPMNVRPEGYYPEPYSPPTRPPRQPKPDAGEPSDDASDNQADVLAVLLRHLAALDTESLTLLREAVTAELETRD